MMRVYKATKEDMTCTLGNGTFQYKMNVPVTAESSKCANRGLHACEYVMDCMKYYPLNGENRFFVAKAEGSIDEDGVNSRIACEKLTLLKELTHREITENAIIYMVRHPEREWEIDNLHAKVKKDEAFGNGNGIAIARGEHPKACGYKGDVLGFVMEAEPGWFQAAACCEIDGKYGREGVWYTITPEGKIVETENEN